MYEAQTEQLDCNDFINNTNKNHTLLNKQEMFHKLFCFVNVAQMLLSLLLKGKFRNKGRANVQENSTKQKSKAAVFLQATY